MALRNFKDSLPWLVPSVAIVIGASGILDNDMLNFGSRDSTAEQPVASATAEGPAFATAAASAPAPKPPVSAEARVTPQTDNVVTRSTASDLLTVEPARAAPKPAPAQASSSSEPELTPARQKQLLAAARAATQPTFKSDTSFQAMRAQCIDDLKQLAQDSRVYFPSGGTSADAAGIEQGRLLGVIAQGCSDVRIRVEGHSDASGDPGANLRLSQRRAEEVIRRIGAAGADTSMFFAEGVGSRKPSNVVGPEPSAFYDRRVEFTIVDDGAQVAALGPVTAPRPWADASCVAELEAVANDTILFYSPGSVSLRGDDLSTAMSLAEKAMQCPQARLRVIGHYADDAEARETAQTARLRAKALMAMLVARGAASEQIIISAPSWAAQDAARTGMPGHRVNFDVIYEEG